MEPSGEALREPGGEPAARAVLSVVVPVYGCRECLLELHRRLVLALEKLVPTFEIVLVNDASPDGSWSTIVELAARDPRVKGINLSRNFGQHYALAAGLDVADGDWVVVMDCDLQHPPEEIEKLYAKALEGHDVVYGRRMERQDGFFKRQSSRLFAKVLGYMTDSRPDGTVSNFTISSRKVVRTLRTMRERNRSYPLLLNWVGYDAAAVDFRHAARFAGRSSYSFAALVGFAVESIVSQSDKPLRLSIRFGFLVSLGAMLFSAWLVFRYLRWGIPVAGWTSVIVSIYFVAGLLFANLGIVGLYIGRIFDATKGRPLYVVESTVNLP
ncbi:MAG TPA: glycosyltransferase family 2 protein [Thermoanaerobaculia bacterium]|nr:glycosyltransferase family 2 protein [Thermoanaerobaculia bacterium]